jgi:hypothetical protein
LLLPAVVAWVWSYVLPSVSTVLHSIERYDLLRPAEQVGGANYGRVFEAGFAGNLGFALLLGLLPLGFALLVAPLLAIVADRAGRPARLVTRALLAVPLAAYAPVAVAIGWLIHRTDTAEVDTDPRAHLVWIVAATSFGLVIAVAGTLFLSALRNRSPQQRPAPALLTVGAVLALGVAAVALQAHTIPALVTGGGPNGSTTTPLLSVLRDSLARMDIGAGMAISTLLLAVLAVLGIAAVVLLLATRARIEFDGWRDPAGARRAGNPVFAVIVVVALVGFLGVVGWALAPWLRASLSGGAELPGAISMPTVLINTWVPPLISTIVAVGLAALAGFGIGALRPLGRFSELLLLPFAPWLFVGIGPLGLAGFIRTTDLDQLNSFVGLIPPTWLSIPALVAFTLLFRGQHARWRAGGGFGRTLVLPALPMLLVAGLLTWLSSAQDGTWSYLVASDPDHMTALNVTQFLISSRGYTDAGGGDALGLILPLPILLVFLVALVAAQVGYLDRLAIRVGKDSGGSPPSVAATSAGVPERRARSPVR